MSRRYLTAVLAILVVLASLSAPVAAQDSSVWDSFTDQDASTVDTVLAGVSGLLERVRYSASAMSPLSGTNDSEAVATDATQLRETFNNNSAAIETYVNARFEGNESEWNVIEIRQVRGDETETQYLVADVENDSFANVSMVESTDRTVDKTVELRSYASDNAANELDTFITEFVDEDRDLTQSYQSELASKYGGHVALPKEV